MHVNNPNIVSTVIRKNHCLNCNFVWYTRPEEEPKSCRKCLDGEQRKWKKQEKEPEWIDDPTLSV
jgi:hypothetical protein